MHQITEAEALNASLDLTAAEVAQAAAFDANLPNLTVPQLMALIARVGASRDRLAATAWCSDDDLADRARIILRLRGMWAGIEAELCRRMGERRKG